jgi:hypothetical protein
LQIPRKKDRCPVFGRQMAHWANIPQLSPFRSGNSRCAQHCAAFYWSAWQGAAATFYCSWASSRILLEGLPSAWDRVSQACFRPSNMVA